jgi:hypothetical protein
VPQFPIPGPAPPPGQMATHRPGGPGAPTVVMPPVVPSYRTPTPSDDVFIPTRLGTPVSRPPTMYGVPPGVQPGVPPGVYRPPIPDDDVFIPSEPSSRTSSSGTRSASPPGGSVVHIQHSPPMQPLIVPPPQQFQQPITVQPPLPPVVVGTPAPLSYRDDSRSPDRASRRDEPLPIQPSAMAPSPAIFPPPPMPIPQSPQRMPSVSSPRHTITSQPPIVIGPTPQFVPSVQPSVIREGPQQPIIIHPPPGVYGPGYPGLGYPGPIQGPQVLEVSSPGTRSTSRTASRSPRRHSPDRTVYLPPQTPILPAPAPAPAPVTVILPSGAGRESGRDSRGPSDRYSPPRSADVPGIYDSGFRPPSMVHIPPPGTYTEGRPSYHIRSPRSETPGSETPESEYERERENRRQAREQRHREREERRRGREERRRERERLRSPSYSETESDRELAPRHSRSAAFRPPRSPGIEYEAMPPPVVHVPRAPTSESRTEGAYSVRSPDYDETPVLPIPSGPRAAPPPPVIVTPSPSAARQAGVPRQAATATPTVVEIGHTPSPSDIDVHSPDEEPLPRVIETRPPRAPSRGKCLSTTISECLTDPYSGFARRRGEGFRTSHTPSSPGCSNHPTRSLTSLSSRNPRGTT